MVSTVFYICITCSFLASDTYYWCISWER